MTLHGNYYKASEDSWGNITITRLSDGASCYLQGDDAIAFRDDYCGLEDIVYPSGPFKTPEEHVDACLSEYDTVLQ